MLPEQQLGLFSSPLRKSPGLKTPGMCLPFIIKCFSQCLNSCFSKAQTLPQTSNKRQNSKAVKSRPKQSTPYSAGTHPRDMLWDSHSVMNKTLFPRKTTEDRYWVLAPYGTSVQTSSCLHEKHACITPVFVCRHYVLSRSWLWQTITQRLCTIITYPSNTFILIIQSLHTIQC